MNNPPPLHSMYLYVMNRCNLHCRHCWIVPQHLSENAGNEQFVEFCYIEKAVREAEELGLSYVKITGGEPFLRKDIERIISFLSSRNMKIDVETNGTLLTRPIVEMLSSNGVDQVSVSLDSVTKERHESFRGVPGCFDSALKGISLLVEHNIKTQIIVSLYQGNVDEIESLIALATQVGATSLKLNPIIPIGRGRIMFGNGENIPTEDLIRIDRWIEDELSKKYPVDVYFDIPVGLKSLKSIKKGALFQCNILNILGILADGTISLCGIGETESELNIGNIKAHSIGDVWRNHPLLHSLRQDIPHNLEGVCKKCIFRFRCRGGCRALVYAMQKNLRGSFFLCEDALRKGLFPPSRMM